MNTLPTRLESIFHKIQIEKMQGVPVINDKLHVKAIGFQTWKQYQLGILITPWFMNLILIPSEEETKNHNKTGSTQNHLFPSGSYEFVAGYEEGIGHYQSCSLFSPMFEFENQEAAELTANEALLAVMNEENIDTSSQNPTDEIEQIWNGNKPQPAITKNFDGSDISLNDDILTHTKASRKKLSERLKEPSSRRDFLRGKAFRDESASTENKQP